VSAAGGVFADSAAGAVSVGGCGWVSGAKKAGGGGDGDEDGVGAGCGSSKRGGKILNGASSPIAPEISRITVLLANRSSRITLPTACITWGKSSGGMTISAIASKSSISKIPKDRPSADRPTHSARPRGLINDLNDRYRSSECQRCSGPR
jgi:hypothetical protein